MKEGLLKGAKAHIERNRRRYATGLTALTLLVPTVDAGVITGKLTLPAFSSEAATEDVIAVPTFPDNETFCPKLSSGPTDVYVCAGAKDISEQRLVGITPLKGGLRTRVDITQPGIPNAAPLERTVPSKTRLTVNFGAGSIRVALDGDKAQVVQINKTH